MVVDAIVQARISSTRLPGKVMKDIAGKPLLHHVVERLSFSEQLDRIIIATTKNPADKEIATWSEDNDLPYYRGSESDVLKRYYNTALKYGSDLMARVTSDDPFKDPALIDRGIRLLKEKGMDFVYNNSPATFPEGLDVEVFTFGALKQAHEEAVDQFEREHVTPFFHRNPDLFEHMNFSADKDNSDLRWTIDTKKDLKMARKVYRELYMEGELFTTGDILGFLKEHPQVMNINSNVGRSDMYKS